MSKFTTLKADRLQAAKRLLTVRETLGGLGLLGQWSWSLRATFAAKMSCLFDPCKVDDWYHTDEVVFSKHSKQIQFYDDARIRECFLTWDDCIAGGQ